MTQQEEQFVKKEELNEMFNPSFLPHLQKIAKRAKEERFGDKEVKFFNLNMVMQFSELEKPLTYDMIEEKIHMQLSPVTQEDIDRAEKDEKKGE